MRLTLGLFAAVAVLSLLALGLVLLLLALLRALVTGQRPAAVTAFSRFRQFSGQQMAGRWGGARNPADKPEASHVRTGGHRPLTGAADVVDVEVREIPADKPKP
jgi:hypothetical protein